LQNLLALAPFKPPDPITAGKVLLAWSQEQLVLSGEDRPNQQGQQDGCTASQHPLHGGVQGRQGLEIRGVANRSTASLQVKAQ
jgi:hypothetical protein